MLPVWVLRQCRRLEARQDREGEQLKLSIGSKRFPDIFVLSIQSITWLMTLLQAAAINTMTEAKVKVAINGFGRIGELPEVFSFLVEPLSGKKTRNVLVSKKSKTP